MAKTALYVQQQPGGLFGIEDQSLGTGSRFWVHSVTGSDKAGYGLSPDAPVATIDYAVALCTADKGDIIYVMPGHNEGLGAATIDLDVAGISVIGLDGGNPGRRPRIDYDNQAASIDIGANNVTIKNLRLLPSVSAVAIGIDVEAGFTDALIEDIEVLPGEDGAGVDEFAIGIDIKAGCSRTVVNRFKNLVHASVAHVVAGVKLTGASDDVTIKDSYIEALGAAAVAPINADTTLSTHLLIKNCLLVSDTQPGIEVITLTSGVVMDCSIFSNLATIAAAIAGAGGASSMAQFRNEYIEVGPERGALIGTASADD